MAHIIEKLPIFPGMSKWQRTLAQVHLLLIKGDFKQATTIDMPSDTPNIADSLNDLSRNLSATGLRCRAIADPGQKLYRIHIGKSDHALDELEACLSGGLPLGEADLIHGRLSGFPETAIQAFIAKDFIKPEELPKDIRVSPEYVFAAFQLSKKHWKEELETGKKWALYIKNNAPDLYDQYIEQFRDR